MEPEGEVDPAKLEAEFAVSRKEKMLAHNMLEKVARALSEAEAASADASLIDRLDMMQMVLTEAAKENVCTNTKCQHYNKKCKMR
jgi:endonuclease/exonuclease/phosphatase (EEP) superfamily protein YafD